MWWPNELHWSFSMTICGVIFQLYSLLTQLKNWISIQRFCVKWWSQSYFGGITSRQDGNWMLAIICHDNGRIYWKNYRILTETLKLLVWALTYWWHPIPFLFCLPRLSDCLALIVIVSPLLILTFRCAWLVKAEHNTSAFAFRANKFSLCSHRLRCSHLFHSGLS